MKTKYFFLIIISLLLINYVLSTKEVKSSCSFKAKFAERNDSIFKIIRIDSIKSIYLIYAEKNDSIYKIMSKKEKTNDCQPIKKGESYKLKIASWFLPEEFHLKMRMSGVKIDNVMIKIERDGIVSDLFMTRNLKGLCYFLKDTEIDDFR